MKKTRMVTGIVLTAGLSLTGVVTASSSGAATPATAKAKALKGGGHGIVCVVQKGGKPVQVVPGKPGVPLPGKPVPGKPSTSKLPGKAVTIKVVNGKVYVNGKLVKGRIGAKCPLPPLPPLPGKGKGFVCVVQIVPGKGHVKPGTRTTVKDVNGKISIDGKLVPKGKVTKDCPPLPPFPGKGGGVVIHPGKSGTSAKGGSTGSVDETGLTTSGPTTSSLLG
jgi:hypothetical protein